MRGVLNVNCKDAGQSRFVAPFDMLITGVVSSFTGQSAVGNNPQEGSVLLSFDPASSYSQLQTPSGANASVEKTTISVGGKLPTPVPVEKGQSVFFNVAVSCFVQLFFDDYSAE